MNDAAGGHPEICLALTPGPGGSVCLVKNKRTLISLINGVVLVIISIFNEAVDSLVLQFYFRSVLFPSTSHHSLHLYS